MAVAAPDRLYFTDDDEANALIASEPMALLIGFALDQQVSVPTAFTGPLKIKQRLGTLDPGAIAKLDPAKLDAAFRERPAVHRFPGSMATKVAALCAHVEDEYAGDASRIWGESADSDELRRRLKALPGFGDMKVKALGSVLAKRFGVEVAQGLVPSHPTLGDVDSPEARDEFQEKKRAYKAKLRAEQH
jgi:uncharacterized HhH-GPD family protein